MLTKKERTELGTRLAQLEHKMFEIVDFWRRHRDSVDWHDDAKVHVEEVARWRNKLIRIRRDFHLEFKDTKKKE